jgi:WD40 repeat protein
VLGGVDGTLARCEMRRMAPFGRGHFFGVVVISSLTTHPPAQILASGSYDDTIKLYIDDPTEDWYCFATLTGHTSTVWALAWSPEGSNSYLASASDDRTVRIWKRVEKYKWETVLTINAHDRTIYSVSWTKGRPKSGMGGLGWLATVGGDGAIKIWELAVSKLLRT